MLNLITKIKCLIKGHKYRKRVLSTYYDDFIIGGASGIAHHKGFFKKVRYRCSVCGKEYEVEEQIKK